MFKNLMKYEFRKGIVPYLIILGSLTVVFITLCFQALYMKKSFYNYSDNEGVFLIMGIILTSVGAYFLIAGGMLYNFVQGIMLLGDEFFRGKGYLTFSTPNSSYKIIASKLLTYFLKNIIYFAIIGIFSVIFLNLIFHGTREYDEIMYFIAKNPLLIILFSIWVFLGQLLHMIFIYLIMTLNITVIDFKHKILSSFLMYFGITMLLRIITFIFRMFIQLSLQGDVSTGLGAFYLLISTKIPIYISNYTGSYTEYLPVPVIPMFIMLIGTLCLFYFTVCRLIDKGINI